MTGRRAHARHHRRPHPIEEKSMHAKRKPMPTRFTALIEREGDGCVALCPELDVASQGDTVDEARANLKEALELFLESASPREIRRRFTGEVYVTQLEVSVG
jgi:predicted RNase H-like HicB family nuclease